MGPYPVAIPAPVLQFVEGPFDPVALPVQFPVVFPKVPGLDLGGITTVAPCARINASILLLSYPLSAITQPVSMPLSKGMARDASAT